MAKHSPAPWKARIDETATVRDKDGQIAIFTHLKTVTGGRRNSDEVAANARLAAAAPELLESLQNMVNAFGFDIDITIKARAAIDKATGQCLKGEE